MEKISLRDLVKIIIHNIIIIILFGIIFAGIFGFVAHKKETTTFTASRSIVVSHNINRIKAKNSQVQADQNLIPTYREILEDNIVSQRARKQLPKKIRKIYTANDISKAITTNSKPNSLVINVKVKANSANDAVTLTNAVVQAFKKELPKVDGQAGTVHLLSPARKASVVSVTKPSIKKYVALGGAFGILFGMVVSFGITTWKKIL